MEFKLIVAGGRDFNNGIVLAQAVTDIANSMAHSVSIVSGMASGADRLAYQFAKRFGIRCYEMPAQWGTYGKRAGFLRNVEMARFADGLLAFWDGKSPGTAHMINTMNQAGKPVHVVSY